MSDQWQNMSGAAGAVSAAYGQEYSYRTTITDGLGNNTQISSGVASYEPMLGGDENPFRQPVFYNQKIPFALTDYYYKEQPMCEAYYPAPVVGYSKVTVTNLGADGSAGKTGYTVHEFYTAKDFPTIVNVTPIKVLSTKSSFLLTLLKAEVKNAVAASQGYSVVLNDMHGKPKSVTIYDAGGAKISSVSYSYQTKNPLAETKQLDNNVQVLEPDGTLGTETLSEHTDMVSDMREEQTTNIGKKIQLSTGVSILAIFPFGFGFYHGGGNSQYESYQAVSTVKVIHQYGLLAKVTKMQNGSTLSTENLLWDAETGDVLLTKTQNEFDDPVYSFTYPAHWSYPGMGQAYQNQGVYLPGFSSDADGHIQINGTTNGLSAYLFPGDEIANLLTGLEAWISEDAYGNLIAIDRTGNVVSSLGPVEVIRSGRRNMASVPVGTLVSLVDPVKDGKLDISKMTEVLDAGAVSYKQDWPIPVGCDACADSLQLSQDGTFCYKDVPATQVDSFKVCSVTNDAYSMYGTYVYDSGYCVDGVSNFSRHHFAPDNNFWVGPDSCCNVDTLVTGQCGSAEMMLQSTASTNDTSGNKLTPDVGISPDVALEEGPMNRSGVWVCGSSGAPTYKWIGVSKSVYFPESKTYYFGIGGDNEFRATVDGNYFIDNTDVANVENFRVWHIYPVYITKGYHIIGVEVLNEEGAASIGMEVYNNTLAELAEASESAPPNILFSTRDFAGQSFTTDYTCPYGTLPFSNDSIVGCRYKVPHTDYANPYQDGLLGNWRMDRQYVYQVDRTAYDTTVTAGIRKAGYYTAFNPFWVYDNLAARLFIADTSNWTRSNEITHYNRKGLETEERDALGNYSAALFGFDETAPVMVASNARESDLFYTGFEDEVFNSSCMPVCRPGGKFGFSAQIDHVILDTTRSVSHTGNYSLKLNGDVTLSASLFSQTSGGLYSFDDLGRLVPDAGSMLRGFSPVAGKKYLISLWVNDGLNSATTGFQLKMNGGNLLVAGATYPVVEGWKKIETSFTAADGGGGKLNLTFSSGGGPVYLDDIRILPFDAEAKTFAYDARSQRLMADLDENNFATFYEYNDEGILVRVKKETEKGIVTVKEVRSSYKMNAQ